MAEAKRLLDLDYRSRLRNQGLYAKSTGLKQVRKYGSSNLPGGSTCPCSLAAKHFLIRLTSFLKCVSIEITFHRLCETFVVGSPDMRPNPCACSSVVERRPLKSDAEGSIPSRRTFITIKGVIMTKAAKKIKKESKKNER